MIIMNPIMIQRRPATYLGPSQVAAVLGKDPFMESRLLKERMEQGYLQEETAALKRGRRYEKTILSLYSDQTGLVPLQARFVTDPHTPRFGGIADALLIGGGIEVKCSGGQPQVYETYRIQAVCYMFLYRRSWWDIVVCNPEVSSTLIIERIHWRDYVDRWHNEWYPLIKEFINNVQWARPLRG